jgi:hypothetical protein
MTNPNFKIHLADLFGQALRTVAPELADNLAVVMDRPKQAQHGDYSWPSRCTAARAILRRL